MRKDTIISQKTILFSNPKRFLVSIDKIYINSNGTPSTVSRYNNIHPSIEIKVSTPTDYIQLRNKEGV